MKSGKIFALAVTLIVAAGVVAIASQTSGTNSGKQTSQSATHTRTKATVHHERGTVSSVAANELVLDHTWKGKEEKTKFKMDSDTKKEGSVDKGDHVMVYYRFEKGQRIATELKALGPKTKAETKKS
jgi:hypothetical protein